MGICLSSSSSWKKESDQNIVYVVGKEASDCNNGGGIRRLTSLYSRQGSKGPNQDSAILCQGYGAEDGVFCGVFDGHGKNGHIVSKIVRDYLPSLLLSHRNIIIAAAEDHHSLENCSKDNENCQTILAELFKEWKDHHGLEKYPKKDENCQTISPELFEEWKDLHGLEKYQKKDENCQTISPDLFEEWKDHHRLEKCLKKDENCQTISPELFEEWKDHHGLEKCPKKDENCWTISPELFEEWKEASISGFKAMDRELKLLTNMDCSYSGTTAVTIIKQGEDVIIANLGDSRAVLGRVSKGRLMAVQLTIDLKPSVPKEAERIRSSNGRVFAMEDEPSIQRIWMPNNKSPGLSMARAFGDFQLKNYGLIAIPEIFHHRLTPNDLFIVLATDGVWDVLSNEQVVSVVASAEKKSSGEAAKLVVEAAAKAWRRKFPSSKVDDCSALCFFLQEKS